MKFGTLIGNPRPSSKSCHIAPCGSGETSGLHSLCILKESIFTRQFVKFGGCPELFVLRVEVAIGARVHSWFEIPTQSSLIIQSIRIGFCPFVSTFGSCFGLEGEIGIITTAFHQPGTLGHDGGKIEGCRHTLRHHIARLLTFGGFDESFEIGSCQLVIYTTVFRVLHREEPLQIEHHLVEEVRSSILALGNVGV